MSKKHLGCQKCNAPTQNGAPGNSRFHSGSEKLCQKDVTRIRRPAGLRTARHFDPGRHLHGVESSKDRNIAESSSLVLMSSPLCRLALVPPPLRRLSWRHRHSGASGQCRHLQTQRSCDWSDWNGWSGWSGWSDAVQGQERDWGSQGWKEARAETREEAQRQRQELRRRRRMGDCRAIAARSWGLRPQPLLLQPRLEGHPFRLPHPCFPLAGAERPPKPWLPHLG